MKITQIIEHKKGVRAVKTTVKPRNFVAKNAIQSGAGAHKDKKKAQKQGDVKHKAQVAEGAEFGAYYNEQLAQKVFDENPNISTSGRAEELLSAGFKIAVLDLGKKQAQGLFGYDEDFPSDFVSSYSHLQKQTEGIGDAISTVATKVGDTLANALPKDLRPFDNDTAAKNQQSMKIVKNESNDEYDDEVGMAENQLQTIQRCARDMEANLVDGENLPEWVQSKITIAKENLVTAFDYIMSEHENNEQGVDEASTNPDTMSATDYDRYQQGQMDQQKRNFKRDEMEHELGDEDRGMYFVVIAKNGKWEHTKAQPRQEGMNAAQKVINALHAKYPSMHLGMQGPDGKVYNMGKGK